MIDVNLLTWNMRGINHPLRRKELKMYVSHLKIRCGAVVETRIRHENLVGILSSWDSSIWQFSHNCALDKSCRMLLSWMFFS